ncbi:MAG TPA: hypothetical protein VLA46_04875 [Saprospiraceae bacterium]|nr:hypothetical protein [Saprospiraceae bacterium]
MHEFCFGSPGRILVVVKFSTQLQYVKSIQTIGTRAGWKEVKTTNSCREKAFAVQVLAQYTSFKPDGSENNRWFHDNTNPQWR